MAAITKLYLDDIRNPPDNSWVTFRLRDEARFHDGHPITAEDVVFSFNILIEEGVPSFKERFSIVDRAEIISDKVVRFYFDRPRNRVPILEIGSLPVLPQHFWADKKFSETTLDPPLNSGPYRIAKVKSGESLLFERVEDYWGLFPFVLSNVDLLFEISFVRITDHPPIHII